MDGHDYVHSSPGSVARLNGLRTSAVKRPQRNLNTTTTAAAKEKKERESVKVIQSMKADIAPLAAIRNRESDRDIVSDKFLNKL